MHDDVYLHQQVHCFWLAGLVTSVTRAVQSMKVLFEFFSLRTEADQETMVTGEAQEA